MVIEPVTSQTWEEARALVAGAGLPVGDWEPGRQHLWAAVDAGRVVGVIGWEGFGTSALVRSLAVDPDRRGRGLGTELYGALEAQARQAGFASLVLLTETADGFFGRQGYRAVARDDLPDGVKSSAEFRDLCPVSARAWLKDPLVG